MAAPTSPYEDATVMERLRRGLADLGCSGAEIVALTVLVAGGVAALALLWFLARPGEPTTADPGGGAGLAELHSGEELVVHVAGEVAVPGLYSLPDGARVADALEQAGGPLPGAALDALNLARVLADGEQLVVPGPPPPPGPAADPGPTPGSAWRPDGLLDLNRATPEDLEELPGIGPVLAERITAHRQTAGGFRAIGDLREVPGIGGKTFQALASLVAV